MTGPEGDESDEVWRHYGRSDPFYGVLTHARYRRAEMNAERRAEFYATGERDVGTVVGYLDAVAPDRGRGTVVDFGCGVGRCLVAWARRYGMAIGVDVSEGMIAEARRAVAERRIGNVRFAVTLDELTPPVDLVFSYLVLQHVEPPRGLAFIRRGLDLLGPGGILAVQFPILQPGLPGAAANNAGTAPISAHPPLPPRSPDRFASALARGRRWAEGLPGLVRGSLRGGPSVRPPAMHEVRAAPLSASSQADPPMQMNRYDLNQIVGAVHASGVGEIHLFRNDSGPQYVGVFLIARRR